MFNFLWREVLYLMLKLMKTAHCFSCIFKRDLNKIMEFFAGMPNGMQHLISQRTRISCQLALKRQKV